MAFRGGGGGWALRLAQAWAFIATVALILVLLQHGGSSGLVDVSGGESIVMMQQPGSLELTMSCKRATRQTIYDGQYGSAAVQKLSEFRSALLKGVVGDWYHAMVSDQNKKYERYNKYPITVNCPDSQPMTRYGGLNGQGDGSKAFCSLSNLKAPCIIYSIGSNGDYSFEQDILRTTQCDVFTFDCTYNGMSVDPRHQYHSICLGQSKASDPRFKPWKELLKHMKHSTVDVLKIDIEGFEYEVFADMTEADDATLPRQIGVEVHFQIARGYPTEAQGWTGGLNFGNAPAAWSSSHMSLTFLHMANLGYAPIFREDNPWENLGCCAEFTFLKVEGNC